MIVLTRRVVLPLLLLSGAAACGGSSTPADDALVDDGDRAEDSASDVAQDSTSEDVLPETMEAGEDTEADVTPSGEGFADVTAVSATGATGAYTFSVTISSPDVGCSRYADWWEVLSADGELLYRRVLGHSHVDEQPFTRSGGPVAIEPETPVFVRAHMNDTGYGGDVVSGSVQDGFVSAEPRPTLPARDEEPPLPTGCAF